MKTKFIFLSLKVINGEYEYSSQSVHEIPNNQKPETFARKYAKEFYGGKPFQYDKDPDGYWYFNGGEVAVKWRTVEIISEEQYRVLSNFLWK